MMASGAWLLGLSLCVIMTHQIAYSLQVYIRDSV